MSKVFAVLIFTIMINVSVYSIAEETVTEKIETNASKSKDAVKSTYRNVQDKTCEMLNGKMECFAKKAKHKVQNVLDKADTKIKEQKKKSN
jgi:hypothetical protein